ncbi:protein TolR [Roseomonas sp. NAR14]|uniref:Protein TolR n=1 Tax=Roseomonas acroporae TaxID=2937791 RepID=A0A9X2BWY3_9PROT|nr:protein TolR [Roseomonas acroporae]MCK8785399.1 protein TolR [Roseomonas acroporae]
MAASLQGRTRGSGRGRYRPLAEINVTPMVDVMLVLLIIFMVAAPLMTSGVPVDLPRTSAQPLNQDNEPITVTVNPEGNLFIGDTEVPEAELVPRLQAIAGAQNQSAAAGQGAPAEQRRIFVRGDRAISYGRVMEVMGMISSAGFNRVALLAEQPAARPGGAPAAGPARPGAPPAGTRPATPGPAPQSAPQNAPQNPPGGRPGAAPRG